VVRTALTGGEPRSFALLLGERPGGEVGGDEVELARQPIAGIPIEGELWLWHGTAWLLSGSVADGEPLRRAVGLRRGSLARGEAQIHNAHGYSDYSAGELDAAGREFERAIAADPRFVDALYNASSHAPGFLSRARPALRRDRPRRVPCLPGRRRRVASRVASRGAGRPASAARPLRAARPLGGAGAPHPPARRLVGPERRAARPLPRSGRRRVRLRRLQGHARQVPERERAGRARAAHGRADQGAPPGRRRPVPGDRDGGELLRLFRSLEAAGAEDGRLRGAGRR